MKAIYTRGVSLILIVVIVAILAIIGFIYFTRDTIDAGDESLNEIVNEELERLAEDATVTDPNSLSDGTTLEEQNSMDAEPGAMMERKELAVLYTDSGFEPADFEITAGTNVIFKNIGARQMWVASDDHPTHEILPDFDQKSVGSEYSFVFTKMGAWNYHNHRFPGHGGTITVK